MESENGIVRKPSGHPVDKVVRQLLGALADKGITVFAVVDHSGEAEKVGLHMPPTKLLIFGNPKGGTPLMLASPSIAIDLPIKILVAEDEQGQAWVSYNSPAFLQKRHGVPENLLQNLAFVEALVSSVAGQG